MACRHDAAIAKSLQLLIALVIQAEQLRAIVGYPFLSTRGKFAGATKGTSVASIVSRKMLPYDIKYRMLPTLTLKSAAQLKFIFTRNLGVFVGRAIPVVGEVVLVIDIFFIASSSVRNYNKIVKREDKIF